MNIKYKLSPQQGFTLVELAVVLIIVGILLGSVIGTLSSRIEATRKSATVDELNEIKQAMMAHAFVNGNLPCPDCANADGNCTAAAAGDGIADFNVAADACLEGDGAGNVPWVTLGLGRNDAWGTRYRYAVQSDYINAFNVDTASGTGVILEPDFVADATGATPHELAINVVAVIFSHGKNGFGGVSDNNVARTGIPAANVDELENANDDENFYMRPETSATATITGKEFDDIVIWISEYELKAKMVEAGKLP